MKDSAYEKPLIHENYGHQSGSSAIPCPLGGFTMGMKAPAVAQVSNLPIGNGHHFDLHLHAAVPNGWRADSHVTNWMVWNIIYKDLPGPVNGWVTLNERPGLGLEHNEDAVKEYRVTRGSFLDVIPPRIEMLKPLPENS